MNPFKPTAFKVVMTDDANELEDQVNELLKKEFAFLGDLRIQGNMFIQPMVKVESIINVPSLDNAKSNEMKGDK